MQTSKQNRTVAVYGASGHTGRFVIGELLRRGLNPIALGRNKTALSSLSSTQDGIATKTASLDDPGSLDRAFEDASAVINCAGPFLDTADAVATAAMRSGIHYLDVTAEQLSAQTTLDNFDAPARDARRLVIPAMGFYGGFADLLAAATIGDWERADEIRVCIALDSWHPTKGTRVTGERNTARRLVISNGRLVPMPQPAPVATWSFAAPFGEQEVVETPLSEIILIARHMKAAEVHTYLGQVALRDLRDPATPPPKAADASGRSTQIFLVDVTVRKDGTTRRAIAHGRDIYAFTAPLVVEAVRRILDGEVLVSGAHAPGAIFDSRAFMRALAPELISLAIA